MKTPCKHLIKNLAVYEEYKTEPDGYGGNSEWTWYELKCDCKKKIEIRMKNQSGGIDYIKYETLTGRPLSLTECRKIFKTNRSLYYWLEINHHMHDAVLRSEGKRTDQLELKIKAKKKIIRKHKLELESMLEDFYSGDVPYNEKYNL